MVWAILAVVGSIGFAINRYRFWRGNPNAKRSKVILKSIGVGLGMLSGFALIAFIAFTYWW